MPALRHIVEVVASRSLAPLGYEVRDRVLSERPEGFHAYVAQAERAGMDVNDWEEEVLGWKLPLPTLERVLFPYLRPDSDVCEIGPGTGRWTRHIISRVPRGTVHLVDLSPWIVRFLQHYFEAAPNVSAAVTDGHSLPFSDAACLDVIFSANTFVALPLGAVHLYARDFARVLRPGGYAVFDYVDPTVAEGWDHLLTQGEEFASVYSFHPTPVIDRVLGEAGLVPLDHYQVGKSTYVIARKEPPAAS